MIENPMVVDRLWRHREQARKAICECAGCGGDIFEGDEVLELTDVHGEVIMLHQNAECAYQFVASDAYHKVAGE